MPYSTSVAENNISVSELNRLFEGFEDIEQILQWLRTGSGVNGGTSDLNFSDQIKNAITGRTGSSSGMHSGQRGALCTPLDGAANNNYAGTGGCVRMLNSGTGVIQGSVLGAGGKL
jgi:hypothetical protein